MTTLQDKPRPKPVRLSVNLAPDIADELKRQADLDGVNATEAIRRAIALMKVAKDERARGNDLAVVRRTKRGRLKFTLIINI